MLHNSMQNTIVVKRFISKRRLIELAGGRDQLSKKRYGEVTYSKEVHF